MTVVYIAIVALAAGLAALLILRARRVRRGPGASVASSLAPEAILLEEATITEPIAPGLEGEAEIRKRGAAPLVLRVRATDPAQAFVRGAKVRVIDCREGCWYVESADEVHLVR